MSATQTPKEKFEAVFPSIVDELESVLKQTKISSDAIEWYKKSLVYNSVGGKANRGLSVIDTYRLLKGKTLEQLSEQEYKRAAILGWCVELVCFVFFISYFFFSTFSHSKCLISCCIFEFTNKNLFHIAPSLLPCC